ncbi:MAG: PEP-CTERM system TPR-repeat protein PrsT [Gammaproteobacteria bacterium]|nr:PEP-CTERM system TPR-repeat protein PrsT [Gammaproteobacteria bacterium]
MTRKFDAHNYFKRFFLIGFMLAIAACGDTGMNEQQTLQKAKAYLDKGDLMAASIELRNTLQKNNENAEARYYLGSINLKIGDLASAEKEFRLAANAGWSQEDIQLQLAHILINKKDFKKFLDEIQTVSTWSVDTQANIAGLRALAEASQNNITKAITAINKGKELNKNAVQVLRSTAILQLAGMLEGDASKTLERAKSLHPNNPEILLLHASNDVQNKKFSRAANTYSRVIALDPAKLLTANGRKASIGLTRLQLIKKNYDKAGATLEPLLKHDDNDPEANYLAGLLAFTQGDLSRAESHTRKLLTALPDSMQAHQLMGKIKYALKDFDQAAHHLSTYLNLTPNDNSIRILLTNTYILLNQPNQARSTLQSTLNANPENAAVLALLSQIEFNAGNIDAGIDTLKKAINANPENAQLHKQMAKAYTRIGQTKLAQNEIALYQKLSNNTEEAQKLAINAYLQAGQINEALETAKLILRNSPENPNTLALIGSLYANSGNNQRARSYFNDALKIQGSHPAATLGLARIERKESNIDKAISLYESLADNNAAGTTPMLELSEIAAQQNRTNDMLLWLEKARNTAPTEIRARMILAKYYLQNAQPKKAVAYTKEAIKQSPERPDIIALHGKALIALKRYNEALSTLKKLVTKLPESAAAQSMLGKTFLRLHMLSDARKHLHKALMIQQDNIIAISLLAETELKDGNPDRSLQYAKTLQKQQPEYYIGHMLEGDIWMAKQNYNKAQHAYNNAWKRQQTATLAKRLFLASRNTSTPDKAIQPLLTWLKNNPDDYSTHLYLASIYQSFKENKKAIKEYENILKLAPDNSTALNNLAWLYSLNGNPKAMETAESAYRFSPENPGILDTYGWILVQQGQVERGQRLIKQAIDAIPGNPDIRYHYAYSLLKSGNTVEGKQILEELIKHETPFYDREEAKRLLKNL